MNEMEESLKKFLYDLEFDDGKSQNTIKSMKSDIKQFRDFIINVESIKYFKEIDQLTIKRFIGWANKNNLEKRSLNRKLSTVRLFFKFLLKEEKINFNPAKLVDYIICEQEEPEFISYEELEKIRKVIDTKTTNGLRDRLIIELLYSTGITSKELLELGEKVFDLEKREIQIMQGREKRVVFCSKRVVEYFNKYVEDKKIKYGDRYNADILFVNGSATRLSDRSLRRIIERYSERGELNRVVTSYTFRHTFALHMIIKGMELEFIKELLGYSTLESLKKYQELSRKEEIKRYIK